MEKMVIDSTVSTKQGNVLAEFGFGFNYSIGRWEKTIRGELSLKMYTDLLDRGFAPRFTGKQNVEAEFKTRLHALCAAFT